MTHILRASPQLRTEELVTILRERPGLLDPRIRFLQGPFPIPAGDSLDLLGLDGHGAWVLVRFADGGSAEALVTALRQAAWVRQHSSWISAMPSFGGADATLTPWVFIVGRSLDTGLQDMLGYLQDVNVACIKVYAFDIGDQQGVYFEPLGETQTGQPAAALPVIESPPAVMPAPAQQTPPLPDDEPNLSLLQPLTDEEIAEFLPGESKEKIV